MHIKCIKMEVVYFSRALVATSVTARRHTPEDSNTHNHSLGNVLQPPITKSSYITG